MVSYRRYGASSATGRSPATSDATSSVVRHVLDLSSAFRAYKIVPTDESGIRSGTDAWYDLKVETMAKRICSKGDQVTVSEQLFVDDAQEWVSLSLPPVFAKVV